MFKKSILISAIFCFTQLCIAQADGDEISIGKYKIIESKILNESRTLLIHLPENYDKSENEYPVLYMLYGNHTTTYFAETVSILDTYGSSGDIPPMILVGITNTDRYRDLIPLNRDGSKTGIDDFINFFKTELIPYIDNNYRTKNYRTLLGPQVGANFAMYSMFKDPSLFNAYVITNPYRWDSGRDLLMKMAEDYFSKNESFHKFMFITHGTNDAYEIRGNEYVDKFSKIVSKNKLDGFRLELNYLPDNKDFLMPLGLRKGIKSLFKNYVFPEDQKVENLADIVNYYNNLSKEFKFDIDVPSHVLVMQADKLSAQGKIDESVEILHYMIEKKAGHENAYWRLGNMYLEEGKLELAKEYIGKMLELVGSDAGMIKSRYNQILKMIEESKK